MNKYYLSKEINIGAVKLGGKNPIRLQSMTNTNTMDTIATVEQCIRMIDAGSELVRITTPTLKDAENLRNIKEELLKRGYSTPLIADVHFNSAVAELAARIVDKVRINPGNYVDKKGSSKLTYTDEEYAGEIQRIKERITPLITICKEYGTALRIGSNHGSLSDRIINRYGNTAEGMVASAMEFLQILADLDFDKIVVSMKSSNPLVMINATRLLIKEMQKANFQFPIHLGVTEAGEGEDGKIRSAIGIGTLINEGIGDTIRVSLTEAPEFELPAGKQIIASCLSRNSEHFVKPIIGYKRTSTLPVNHIGGGHFPIVISSLEESSLALLKADLVIKNNLYPPEFKHISLSQNLPETINPNTILIVELDDSSLPKQIEKLSDLLKNNTSPIILKRNYSNLTIEEFQLKAGIELGALLVNEIGNGIWLEGNEAAVKTAFNILQSTKARITKTEFISCPSCGRTLFDITSTLKQVKDRTAHLKGLKIAVMGCIVNGPGEMGEADYGCIGAGNGVVNLYKGKDVIKKKIPSETAVEELIELIKENGDWVNKEGDE